MFSSGVSRLASHKNKMLTKPSELMRSPQVDKACPMIADRAGKRGGVGRVQRRVPRTNGTLVFLSSKKNGHTCLHSLFIVELM